jgi:DNA-binding NarL/FixJ family response regulator
MQPGPFLTKRERVIFDMLCQKGLTNKEIAAELLISESTVKQHIKGIRQRLGADSNMRALLPLVFEYGRQVERTARETQQ